MEDGNLAPWLKSAATSDIKPSDNGNLAPWLQSNEAGPSATDYAVDAAKAGPSGLGQGVISLAGVPGDVQRVSEFGAEKASKPLGWLANKFEENFPNATKAIKGVGEAISEAALTKFMKAESAKTLERSPALANSGDMMLGGARLPSSADIQKSVEGVTGPFYEAKYGPGKAVQTAGQILPSLATGGAVRGAVAKAVGGGITSELAGEGADKLKGHLPNALQPWAEPVARTLGILPGTVAPSLARRGVTPLPMTDARLAETNALRATNPALVDATSAGILTESPRIMGLEARSPRMAGMPEAQSRAFTQGVMGQAGAPNSMFDTAGKQLAAQNGETLRLLQNAHRMTPAEFASMNTDINRMGRPGSELFKAVGPSEDFNKVKSQIVLGPGGGNPMPKDMTGQRYGALKQIIQNAGEAAPTPHESTAIFNARDRMKQAFQNSMPPDEAARLRDLDTGYSNWKTIENIPTKAGERTITPDQVNARAPVGSELEAHANQAASVMRPLPEPDTRAGHITKAIGSILGTVPGLGLLAHGHVAEGVGSTLFGSYYGMGHLNDVVQALKDTTGRVAARPLAQDYLKNQRWRPGPDSSAPDREMLMRLLAAPPVKQLGPSQQP